MTEQLADDRQQIVVVCDDASHARGKVADIETFTRSRPGQWSVKRARADGSVARMSEQTDSWGDYWDSNELRPGQRVSYKCKLCGLDLQRGTTELFAILDQVAAAGVSQLTLRALVRLVSKPT